MGLRMTKGPTNACIAFHCDGGYVTSTPQIALVAESSYGYTGGELCFFVNDKVHVLDRPVGSLVQYPPKVPHGVTHLSSGTQKSLIVVDKAIVVDVEKVDQVIENCTASSPVQGPRASTWIACYDRPADHVLIPCGHFCLCSECVQHVGGRCPLCGIPIEGKQSAYL
mmetsp:Transcript_8261/g.14978  ORF Transcript_8261/g.14978 Transcript_8261/m.14978 type:complete len:167 (+) Transcript_8261:653-1153(+)